MPKADARQFAAEVEKQKPTRLDTIADLRTYPGTATGVLVTEKWRGGVFAWRSGNQKANCDTDPLEGVWVAPMGKTGRMAHGRDSTAEISRQDGGSTTIRPPIRHREWSRLLLM